MINLSSKILSQINIIHGHSINLNLFLERYRRIKKADKLRQEDIEREAAMAAEKAGVMPKPPITRGKSRDVERGIN